MATIIACFATSFAVLAVMLAFLHWLGPVDASPVTEHDPAIDPNVHGDGVYPHVKSAMIIDLDYVRNYPTSKECM